MSRDDKPIGAEQRARRQRAEAEQKRQQTEHEMRLRQQAEAFYAERQRAENEQLRAQQRAAQQQADEEQRIRQQAETYYTQRQRAENEQLRAQERAVQQQIENEQRRAQQQVQARQRDPQTPYQGHEERPSRRAAAPLGAGKRRNTPHRDYRAQDEGHHYNDNAPQNEESPRTRSRWFTAILMVTATLVACLFISLFLVQSAFDLLGLNQPDRAIEVTIPQDASTSDVVRILGDTGVINQTLTFRLFLSFRSVGTEDFRPGNYVFNSNMSYDEVIRALMIGITTRDVVRLTFPEGWTLWQSALFLEEHGVVDAEEFIEYLNTAEFGFSFVNDIEYNPLRFHRLEGYLFPDTYDFYVGENVSSVARKFLRNFNDRVMTPQVLRRMDELGWTVDQTLTLASIIQREAGLSDDMRYVSSVFHNRLNSPNFPRLESDVTDLYIRYEIKPRIAVADHDRFQDLFDAYDTYVAEGLPAGPVCNPGMDAIMAALFPEDTPFFFFVTDVLGDFYYAVTYERHRHNIGLVLAVGEEIHGTGTRDY